jgi:nitroreductase
MDQETIFKSLERDKSMPRAGATARDPEPQDSATLSAFKQVLEARRSIRIYDGTPLPESVMRDCLQDATLAPSSSNLQAYELYWVRDPAKKKALAAACLGQPAATTAGDLVVVVARQDLWRQNLKKLLSVMTRDGQKLPDSVAHYYNDLIPKVMASDPFGIMNLVRRAKFSFDGLKKPMIRTPVSRGDHRIYGHVQATLAAQTLMLSFSAHGYDSCPMGGFDEHRVKKLLDLPAKAEVTMVISAGTRKPEGLYGPRHRLELSDLIKEV